MKYMTVEWGAPSRIGAIYTTQHCGNLSYLSSEGESNWKELAQSLGLPMQTPWLRQVHGTTLVEASTGYGCSADAVQTRCILTPCAVLTADCVPILLSDETGEWIAAIHAGWQGLVRGIIATCLDQLLCKKERAFAWIGPSICQNHYQVDKNVKDQLLPLVKKNQQKLIASWVDEPAKFMVDLAGIAEQQLLMHGVRQVWRSDHCSFGNENFYSHRQDNETGRFASIIWKKY